MNANTKCRTILIPDSPATTDELGSHERIANAIADIINTDNGGRCIGLEGSWGSGKSTIIKLLCAKISPQTPMDKVGGTKGLASNLACKVVVFDAWEHQGDPLRHTFLESLIDNIFEENKQAAQKKKELYKLLSRTSTSEVTEQPIISWWQRILLSSLLLVPIGVELFKTGLERGIVFWNQGYGWATDCNWGLILIFLPLVIAITPDILQHKWIKKIFKRIGLTYTITILPEESTWAIFLRKSRNDIRNITTENIDLTSLAFEKFFDTMMKEVLIDSDTSKYNHLTIILDNLDRIPESNALSVWSTIQNFFQTSEHEKPKSWAKQIWVIVPYDHKAISRLWNKDKTSLPDDPMNATMSNDDHQPATHFFDKTFQVRLEIPPPALSNWQKFLLSHLKHAFPDHQQEDQISEFQQICKLFWAMNRNHMPTPRELKLFVNQIGAIHRQWQDQFALLHVAYYILLRKDHDPSWITDNLLKESWPDEHLFPIIGTREKFGSCLAALTFNLDVDTALQILLPAQIQAALENAATEKLKELSIRPGFWAFFESISLSSWLQEDCRRLANTGHCIAQSCILDQVPSKVRNWITSEIHNALKSVVWDLNTQTAIGIKDCLLLVNDDQLTKDVIRDICNSPMKKGIQSTDEVPEECIYSWVDALHLIMESLNVLKLDDLKSDIKIPSPLASYIKACMYIVSKYPDKRYWSVFKSNLQPDIMGEYLSEAISKGEFTKGCLSAAYILSVAQPNIPWNDIGNCLSARIQMAGITNDEIAPLVEALYLLQISGDLDEDKLGPLQENGYLLNQFHETYTTNDAYAMAICTLAILKASPDASSGGLFSNSSQGRNELSQLFGNPSTDFVKYFTNFVIRFDEFLLVHKMFEALPEAKPLFFAILESNLDKPVITELMSPDDLLKLWPLLTKEPRWDKLHNFVAHLIEDARLIEHICNKGFDIDRTNLYGYLLDFGISHDIQFINWCQHGMLSINAQQWNDTLNQQHDLIHFTINLLKHKVPIELADDYRNAMVNHARNALSGKANAGDLEKEWHYLPYAMSNENRRQLRLELCSAAVDNKEKIRAEFFKLYGREIADTQALESTKNIVRNLFIPIVKGRQSVGLKWLLEVLASDDFLNSYSPKIAVAAFDKIVKKSLGRSKPPEAMKLIRQIADIRGIKL